MTSIIIQSVEINKIDFSSVEQTLSSLVYSIDKTQTYVTWATLDTPEFVPTLEIFYGPYTDGKLKSILSNYEWMILV
jgi:hypothetical protein